MTGAVTIRAAHPAELDALAALLPRLADFDVPQGRDPEDLWRGDLALLEAWARGTRDDLHVLAATLPAPVEGDAAAAAAAADSGLPDGEILAGLAMIRLTPEPLSGAAAAHLDVLAVARRSEGRGVGLQLIRAAEAAAVARGATCMTLHVIDSNGRARRLYERAGYQAEVVRYIRRF